MAQTGDGGAAGSGLVVRAATGDDMDALWDLYGAACDAMAGTPHDCEWVLGVHPTRAGLARAARAGDLFVAEHAGGEGLAGAFVLNGEQTRGYERAAWPRPARADQVAVVHLLVVAPACRGRGVGRALVGRAAELARARGKRVVRLDVFTNNAPARSLYASCGFADVGPQELVLDEGHVRTLELMELDLG